MFMPLVPLGKNASAGLALVTGRRSVFSFLVAKFVFQYMLIVVGLLTGGFSLTEPFKVLLARGV